MRRESEEMRDMAASTDLIRTARLALGLLLVLAVLVLKPLAVGAQVLATPKQTPSPPAGSVVIGNKLYPPDQVAAIDMVRSISDDLRKELSNPAAIPLEAQIGDIFWDIDEDYARATFRRAFDAGSQPTEDVSSVDNKLREEQLKLVRRRAAALSEVLRLLGKHDQKYARNLLDKYESEKLNKETKKEDSGGQFSLLAQIALELAESNPEQASRLGTLSLAGQDIPDAIGQLLFALSKHGRAYSDPIFVGVIENLRRNGYHYDNSLSSLCNYVSYSNGRLFSEEYRDQALMLMRFFSDAAQNLLNEWRQAKIAGAPSVPNSAASFVQFLLARVVPIMRVNASDRLLPTQGALEELSSGLSQQQIQDADDLANMIRQQRAINDSLGTTVDDQFKRAENEKDVVIRDNLWRIIAVGMMRSDPEKALTIAARIDDPVIKRKTEDDIRLVLTSSKLKLRNYPEATRVASNLNDLGLRARALAAIATANRSADNPCDTQLMAEAYSTAMKDVARPEKVRVILSLAGQFSKCGIERGFELLSAAIKVTNQLPSNDLESSILVDRRPRVVTYTVVGGRELTTDVPTSRESINFDDVTVFAKQDLAQARNLAYQFDDHVFRAKYLITVARAILEPPPSNSPRHP